MKKFLGVQLFVVLLLCFFAFSACATVDFKINFVVDGENYATVDTNGGETIKMPENPTKDGYTFDGWFWDKDIWEKPFTANSLLDAPLSSDMSVYAKWQEDDKSNKNALLLSANGFTFDGNNGKISVANDTETYSFINQIQVSAGASWVISTDIYGMQTIVTKTIPLNIGDNTVYLLITSGDGKNINLYTMTVRRRPIYTVNIDADIDGYYFGLRYIEEGYCTTEPEVVEKIGCVFNGWNYDFTIPITRNITIHAEWEVKPEMSDFYFTSSPTACTITGIKDETITEIIVPDYVTNINGGAFGGCSKLESITLPFGGIRIRETGSETYQYPFGYIFGTSSYTGGIGTQQYYCISRTRFGSSTSLTEYTTYYIPTTLKSVTITGGNILDGAFYNCSNLTSITISESVTSIGNGAFFGCTGLTSITFKGTKLQWQAVSKGSNWNYYVPLSCLVHCMDGDVNI